MSIGHKIAVLRKQNNLTQAQLAKAVGVSIPAVSKWENNLAAPDIALLAPIARMLHTDVNELLSYQEKLSEKEVQQMMQQVKETCRKQSYQEGMELAFLFLKEYPQDAYLKLEIATMAGMCVFTLENDGEEAQAEYLKFQERSLELLEDICRETGTEVNPEIKDAALAGLTARYMQNGRLEEAEKILKELPSWRFDGKQMLSSVYLLQERFEQSRENAQKNLLYDFQNLLMDIRTLFSVAMKQEDKEKAQQYAEDYYRLGKIVNQPHLCPSELRLDLSVHTGAMESAMQYFSDYVDEINREQSDDRESIYYDAIVGSMVSWSNDMEDDIKVSMRKGIEWNPQYKVLLDTEQGKAIMKRLSK